MGNGGPSGKSPKRLKRVKRLKKLIVITVLVLIFVPLALCIYFGCMAYALKADLDKANEELNYYLEQSSENEFLESIEETENSPGEDTLVSVDAVSSAPKAKDNYNPGDVSLTEEELYAGYRKIYLTFDDGPSPNTDEILDILKQYDIPATFFVVRRDGRNYESMYRRIVDEGHALGMHSCTHIYRNLYKDEESFFEDTKELRDFLYLVTGVESDIYRFPGGSSNNVSRTDMNVFADVLESEGIAFFDWNISSGDATSIPASKDTIVRNVTGKIKNFDEAVILFHDLSTKDTTVQALPEIIEYILAMDENVVFLPITKDTNPIHHLSVKDMN